MNNDLTPAECNVLLEALEDFEKKEVPNGEGYTPFFALFGEKVPEDPDAKAITRKIKKEELRARKRDFFLMLRVRLVCIRDGKSVEAFLAQLQGVK